MAQEFNERTISLAERQGFIVNGGIYSKEIAGERYSFRKITDIDDLEATTPLQKTVFFKDDSDYFVCPGHMLATLNKLGGIIIAGYNSQNKLVNFSYNWPMVKDNRSDLLLLDMLGVSEEVQDRGIGYESMKILLIEAAMKDIKEIRFTYDPLKMRNANIYLRKIGAKAIDFEEDPYGKEGLGGDRFLASWDISNPEAALNRMSSVQTFHSVTELNELPVVTYTFFPKDDRVILPAPQNDLTLTPEWRNSWGIFYRNVGRSYFPEYAATEFLTESIDGVRTNRYILSKK
jgi:predicted GNAT superfamily acetyltransferase